MRGDGGRRRIWSCDYPDVAGLLHSLSTQGGSADLVPYQTRPSGASAEYASRVETLVEVQKRGHWMYLKSCLRYERAGQLLKAVASCPAGFHAQARRCGAGLTDIMPGRQAPGPRFPGL